jgi:hypothetical protein
VTMAMEAPDVCWQLLRQFFGSHAEACARSTRII